MKCRIIVAILATAMITTGCSAEAAVPKTRKMNAVYHDYMCVTTSDGHDWLLDDTSSANNSYMTRKTVCMNGKRVKVYMPIFKEGQKLRITFDTKGTRKLKDDEIVKITKRK